jgi:hypothetical protein
VNWRNPTPDCPKCGSFGEEVFNRFDCSNPLYSNFPRPRARDPEPPDEDTKEMEAIDLSEIFVIRPDLGAWLESEEATAAIERVIRQNR